MSAFVTLLGSAAAGRLYPRLGAQPPGWRADLVEPGWLILRPDLRPPALRRLGDGTLVVGDLFARPDGTAAAGPAAFDGLLSEAWGGYVAVRRQGAGLRVLRDPSGGFEAAVWRRDGVWIVASELPDWLDPWLPRELGVDIGRVAAQLAAPGRVAGLSPLAGLDALAPGALWADGDVRQAWRPEAFATRPPRRGLDLERELAGCVDGAVAALARGPVLLEISGGLDSAIVAASARAAGAQVVGAVNYFTEDLQGDERRYARDVAQALGLDLAEAPKPRAALDLDALAAASGGLRPAAWALDPQHDLDLAARCVDLGAETILTGRGGDNVFFQTATPLIAADGLRAGLSLGALANLARWQGRSAYGVALAAIRGARGAVEPDPAGALLGPAAREAARGAAPHPWLCGIDRLPPAKRMQVASLVGGLSAQGPTLRGRTADLRHPLLSQPLLELCLSIPTLQLTRGGRDRGLARAAFAGRVPVSVAARRAKGRLSAHYGQVIAASLPELRALLLDGRLAAEGLLDPREIEAALRPEVLMWRGGYGPVIQAVLVELWVRAWEGRLAGLGARRAAGSSRRSAGRAGRTGRRAR